MLDGMVVMVGCRSANIDRIYALAFEKIVLIARTGERCCMIVV